MLDPKIVKTVRKKNVLVLGLGTHGGGVATTNWLVRHGAIVTVTDLRTRRDLQTALRQLRHRRRIRFVLGRHRMGDIRSAELIVQNPAVPNDSPYLHEARARGIPIVNEAVLFFAHCPCPIIAVTGTKGKSTTSTLIHRLLKAKYGSRVFLAGNIRTTAMLAVMDRLKPSDRVVVELSSWHLERFAEFRTSAHIAVVTNLLDDHLNRYPSRAAYHRAKSLVWRWQRPQDLVILNHDDPRERVWAKRVPSRAVWFGHRDHRGSGAFLRGSAILFRRSRSTRILAHTNDLRLPGAHMRANALAALCVAGLHGVSAQDCKKTLRSFRGLAGRLETVRIVHGVSFINDTTATAPAASIAALETFSQSVILIAGGTDKGFRALSFRALAQAIQEQAHVCILLPGTATQKLRRELVRLGVRSVPAPTMDDAVHKAFRRARPGDVVLLSPGAASFGLFRHEFERGDAFVRAVRQLSRP